jgi:uncharacterized Fe-S cluster-containing radical SAM superfamily enzyme
MPSVNSVTNRRLGTLKRIAELPGAVQDDEALKDQQGSPSDFGFLVGLSNAASKSDQLSLLTAQTEVLELFYRVVTPLVARIEALEAIQSGKGKRG